VMKREPPPDAERCEAVVYTPGHPDGRCMRRSVYFGLCVAHYRKSCTGPIRRVRPVDPSCPKCGSTAEWVDCPRHDGSGGK